MTGFEGDLRINGELDGDDRWPTEMVETSW